MQQERLPNVRFAAKKQAKLRCGGAEASAQAAEAAYLLKPAFKLELLHDYKSLPGAGATQKSRSSTRRVTIRLDHERSLLA